MYIYCNLSTLKTIVFKKIRFLQMQLSSVLCVLSWKHLMTKETGYGLKVNMCRHIKRVYKRNCWYLYLTIHNTYKYKNIIKAKKSTIAMQHNYRRCFWKIEFPHHKYTNYLVFSSTQFSLATTIIKRRSNNKFWESCIQNTRIAAIAFKFIMETRHFGFSCSLQSFILNSFLLSSKKEANCSLKTFHSNK